MFQVAVLNLVLFNIFIGDLTDTICSYQVWKKIPKTLWETEREF